MQAFDRVENPFRTALPLRGAAPSSPQADTLARRLRPMTGFEEELVETRAIEANTARLVNEILARCLVPPGADYTAALEEVRRLNVAARNGALVALRRVSLGSSLEANAVCPECGTANSVAFSLDDLPAPDPSPAELQGAIEMMTPGGLSAALRIPDAGDQEALLDAAPATRAAHITLLLSRTLMRLGEREGPFDTAFVHALPSGERRALETALEAGTPRFDLTIGVVCERCAHEFSAPLDVQAFFLPR